MRLQATLLLGVCASLAVVAAAAAAPRDDMNDSTYLAVARCAGMAEGVGADAKPFNMALDAQSGVRTSDVMDRADEAKSDARRNASHEGEDGKATIAKQLDGMCRGYISAS